MTHREVLLKLETFVFSSILVLSAYALRAEAPAASGMDLPVVEKNLSNGLKVLVVEEPGIPVVSFSYMQPVGAQDAPKGKTGLPHMLEHMMFKGTQTIGCKDFSKEEPILEAQDRVAQAINDENAKLEPDPKRLKELADEMKKIQLEDRKWVVKDELDALYTQNGGQSLNAWTSQDATNYTVTLPANKVALYATIEQDRLNHPVFREFYSERDVVAQERRWRTESSPEGKLEEVLECTAFAGSPYKDPTIGWMTDIHKLMRPDAVAFYKSTYRPDRGVLAVVGGVKADEILPLFEKTIGQVPNPPVAPLTQAWTQEPPQEGPKTARVKFDADPLVMMGWHMPNFPHKDSVTLDVLCGILTTGNTSRLVKQLVLNKKMVTSISASTGYPGDRSPDLMVMQFEPAPKQKEEKIIAAIDLELAAIRKKGVTQEELDRARRAAESSFLWSKTNPSGLATDLAYNQAVHGDWRYLTKYIEMVRSTTSDDIKQAAQKYLVDDNRTVATLERGK
jgi:predicted Zn-dependent peptidase